MQKGLEQAMGRDRDSGGTGKPSRARVRESELLELVTFILSG